MSEKVAASPRDKACDSQHVRVEPPSPSAASRIWLPEIIARIGSHLPANDYPLLRLVDKTAAAAIPSGTIRLSQRVPRAEFAAYWSAPAACLCLTYDQRLKLLTLVAASGDVVNLDAAMASVGIEVDSSLAADIMRAAAEAGEVSAWLELAKREQFSVHQNEEHLLIGSARKGCPKLRDMATAQGRRPCFGAAITAAEHGHAALAAWFLSFSAFDDEDGLELVNAAARCCNLEGFQRLCREVWSVGGFSENEDKYIKRGLLATAAASPMPDWRERIDWLTHAHGSRPCTDAYARAAELLPGKTAVERFAALRELGFPLDQGLQGDFVEELYDEGGAAGRENVFGGVLRSGNADALRWLAAETQQVALAKTDRSWGAWWDKDVVRAAREGRLEVLRALADVGWSRWNGNRLATAAVRGGALEVLRWLVDTRRAGGRPTWRHFMAAARVGNAELLGYLRARGCYWSRQEENGLASNDRDSSDDRYYSSDDDEDEEEYYGDGNASSKEDESGGDGEACWAQAARSGCEAALEKLAEMECPMPTSGRPYLEAAGHGDLRTMGVLRRLQVPLGPAKLLTEAIRRSHRYATLGALQLMAAWWGPGVHWGRARRAAEMRTDADKDAVLQWINEHIPGRPGLRERPPGGKKQK